MKHQGKCSPCLSRLGFSGLLSRWARHTMVRLVSKNSETSLLTNQDKTLQTLIFQEMASV